MFSHAIRMQPHFLFGRGAKPMQATGMPYERSSSEHLPTGTGRG